MIYSFIHYCDITWASLRFGTGNNTVCLKVWSCQQYGNTRATHHWPYPWLVDSHRHRDSHVESFFNFMTSQRDANPVRESNVRRANDGMLKGYSNRDNGNSLLWPFMARQLIARVIHLRRASRAKCVISSQTAKAINTVLMFDNECKIMIIKCLVMTAMWGLSKLFPNLRKNINSMPCHNPGECIRSETWLR